MGNGLIEQWNDGEWEYKVMEWQWAVGIRIRDFRHIGQRMYGAVNE